MPSGSKKRKSSKKPKPDDPPSSQGEPPELETGLEEDMAKDGEEMGDGSASPRDTGADAEILAEGGLQAKEISGEVLQGGHVESDKFKKVIRTEDAFPENGKGDLPLHAAVEPKIPLVMEGKPRPASEPEGEYPIEIARREPQLRIEPEMDTPLIETDAAPAEIKPEMEMTDAPMTEFKGDTDPVPDAPPDGIKLEADIGQDEIEFSVESALVERESEPNAAPVVSESRMDEAPVPTCPANIEPETDKAPVEMKAEVDAAPADVKPEIDEALVEMKPEIDEATVEPETDAAPAHIEPAMDKAPVEIKPEADGVHADIQPETKESLVKREPDTDEIPADAEPAMDVAPADTVREADVAQLEMDVLPVEILRQIDACGPEVEAQADAAVCEIETEAKAMPYEIKPEAPVDTEQDDVAQAEIKPEPEVEALAEVQLDVETEDLESSVETEAHMEPLKEAEPEPKPEPEEPPQEFEPEPESKLKDTPQEIEPEPKPELQEPPQEIESEKRTELWEPPREIESEPRPEPEDLSEDVSLEFEGKAEPLQEVEPELEAEAAEESKPADVEMTEIKAEEGRSAETELDQQNLVEGEVGASLETIPEPEVVASREIEPEAEAEVSLEAEREPEIEALAGAKSDDKLSIEIESDQQDLVEIEPDQHDQQPHEQERGAELGELETPVSEDSRSQEELLDAPELSVVKDELADQVEPAISASNLVDDSTSIPVIEASIYADNKERADELEFLGKLDEGEDLPPSAVVLEGEGGVTVEGVFDDQDAGADPKQKRKTEVDNEQCVPDELADESKEGMDEREKAGDDGHDEDQAVLASGGDGSMTVLLSEQELGIEQPPADVIDVDECVTEVTLLKDQELVSEQPQPSIEGAADEPPSAESELVEQGLNTTLPPSESEMILDPHELKDEAAMPADDMGEDESALSTVAEAGSVLNDFDENVHYEHELHTDFHSFEHIPDSRDFDDTFSPKAPELVETELEEELDSEACRREHQRVTTESNGNEIKPLASEGDLLTDEVDLNVGQGLGNPYEQAEVLWGSVEGAEAAEESHAPFAEERQDDVQLLPSTHLGQVVQDSVEDEVYICKDGMAANEDLRLLEEERTASEDGNGAAASILGVDAANFFPNIAENELMSKSELDAQYNLSRSEAPSNDLLDLRDKSSIDQSETNNMDETEIHAVDAKELKEAEHSLLGRDSSDVANQAPAPSVSPGPEGKDIGVQAFHQKSTQESSLPLLVPAHRALENVNVKSIEHPSGGVIVEGRKKWLGCCGMFDVLLGKN